MSELELYHYGVKGMRWGHRKKYTPEYATDTREGRLRGQLEKAKAEKKAANREFNKA